jgi:cobalt-zinc-cadmium efflux system outer membrane protein
MEQERCAARAAQRRAGRYPSPTVDVDLEDWLGSGDFRAVRELQLTVQVSQDIELGGKRGARQRVARVGARIADWRLAEQRNQWLAGATAAFYRGLYAQQLVRASRERLAVARQVVKVLRARLDGGKGLPAELSRGRVRAELARIALVKARHALRRARRSLAAHWGSLRPRFGRLRGALDAKPRLPAREALLARVARHPAVRLQEAAVAERRAKLALQQTLAWPDLGLRAGYRWLNGPGDSAVVVGVSIPLPLFSRRSGAVAAARHRLARARATRARVVLRLREALLHALDRRDTARKEAEILRDAVLPAARQAFERIRDAVRLGRLTAIDLLEAQRDLVETRARHLRAWRDLALARVAVKRAAGLGAGVRSAGGKGAETRRPAPRSRRKPESSSETGRETASESRPQPVPEPRRDVPRARKDRGAPSAGPGRPRPGQERRP